MVTLKQKESAMEEDIRNYRTPFIIEGVLLMILGFFGIVLPGVYTLATEYFIGGILVVLGIIQLFRAFKTAQQRGFFITLISAILALVIGSLLLLYPLQGILSLTALLIVFFFIEALVKWIYAVQMKELDGAGWLLFSGLISLALAAILYYGWPGTAMWAIGLLVGIDLLFAGITLVSIGWQIPKKA